MSRPAQAGHLHPTAPEQVTLGGTGLFLCHDDAVLVIEAAPHSSLCLTLKRLSLRTESLSPTGQIEASMKEKVLASSSVHLHDILEMKKSTYLYPNW